MNEALVRSCNEVHVSPDIVQALPALFNINVRTVSNERITIWISAINVKMCENHKLNNEFYN